MITLESLGFAHSYEAVSVERPPSDVHWVTGQHTAAIFVRISTRTNSWTVACANRLNYPSRLLACPNGDQLCIIAGGEGYILDVGSMAVVHSLEPVPLLEAVGDTTQGLLILGTFNDLFAYDSAAHMVWRTTDLAQDGLRLRVVSRGWLTVDAWMVSRESWDRFQVNLATGAVERSETAGSNA